MSQCIVKHRTYTKATSDHYISASLEIPVITKAITPETKRSINKTIRHASKIDEILRDVSCQIYYHQRALKSKDVDPGDMDFKEKLSFEIGLNDANLLSILFQDYEHEGSPAPSNTYWYSVIIDSRTGMIVEPCLIFPGISDKELRGILINEASPQEDDFPEHWKDIVQNDLFEYWLKPKGVGFYFNCGGASGPFEIEVPYKRFSKIIDTGNKIAYLVGR